MIERPCQSADTAPVADPFGVIGHTLFVRTGRTMVNLPNVEIFCDAASMVEAPATGTKLLKLKQRSGMSLGDIAIAAGYKAASSIQRYFNSDYDGEYLPPKVAEKLAKAFVGKGRPAIMADEITSLAAYTPAGIVPSSPGEHVSAAFVWHVARQFGADVERDDPEVLRLARFLQALLKLLASHPELDAPGVVDGLFAGAALQAPNGSAAE